MKMAVIWIFGSLLIIGVSADEGFYMNKGANKGYDEGFIIEHFKNISLVQCAHQCRRNKDCKHTTFHDGMGLCRLLIKATNFTDGGTNGQNIYSTVEFIPGMCTFDESK